MLVDDSMPPVLDALRVIDPTFREISHMLDSRRAIGCVNEKGFKVEFLTPNRTGDEVSGQAAPMPALGGFSAQPLRYLDFLIYNPVRSVLLHKGGIPVTVPAPARYAVHKLIVSSLRRHDVSGREKSRKDAVQAGLIAESMLLARQGADLGYAWMEAWDRGPKWQENLVSGFKVLDKTQQEFFRACVEAACHEDERDMASVWFDVSHFDASSDEAPNESSESSFGMK